MVANVYCCCDFSSIHSDAWHEIHTQGWNKDKGQITDAGTIRSMDLADQYCAVMQFINHFWDFTKNPLLKEIGNDIWKDKILTGDPEFRSVEHILPQMFVQYQISEIRSVANADSILRKKV